MSSLQLLIVVLVAFACTDAGVLFDGNKWNDLRVRWTPLLLDGFFSMPRLAEEARAKGYTTPPEEVNSTDTRVQVLCPDRDPTVCLLFDKQGFIAGIEIGVVRAQVDNKEYAYENHHMFRPITRYGYDIYATKLFFVQQAVLNAGGRTSMAANGTGTGLWLQDGADSCTNCPLFEIPRMEADIQKTAYTKESCIPTMGRHYYYNISESMHCEDFFPIFGLYRKGELLGFGYQIFGRIPKLGSTTWFENVPPAAVKPTIPNAPACIVDRAVKYGIVSLHVYFVDNPYFITCLFE